ncbi:PAS domain S-box-containing protein [Thermocatellispora tengchongensis]|uniref:histidine kinase n=1 Tax=Thermocatellispora tengchongensis TaxID=1073253 RepID=A0A840P3K8_9ACTN|nr:SpoIIE family protein phosphatase [Thermocatellispora tengchongensis]MBB5135884.1 PAS domain S-box-containing protein [Thermocatellispora tengchongensis]
MRAALFAGEGEMAACMRSLDWGRTPLGEPEQWPESLRNAVRIVLGSRFPMFVFWGRELYQLYNDAYLPILGENKHPRALVQPAAECWPEIWDVVGPMFESVLATGVANYVEDQLLWLQRNGFVEETYFTYSYSPAPDDDGSVGGVFCACFETTRRVQGKRRLQLARDAAARAAGGTTADDACARAAEALEGSPDLPFALFYRVPADPARPPELIAESGLSWPADPALLRDPAAWPLREVLTTPASPATGPSSSVAPAPAPAAPVASSPAEPAPVACAGSSSVVPAPVPAGPGASSPVASVGSSPVVPAPVPGGSAPVPAAAAVSSSVASAPLPAGSAAASPAAPAPVAASSAQAAPEAPFADAPPAIAESPAVPSPDLAASVAASPVVSASVAACAVPADPEAASPVVPASGSRAAKAEADVAGPASAASAALASGPSCAGPPVSVTFARVPGASQAPAAVPASSAGPDSVAASSVSASSTQAAAIPATPVPASSSGPAASEGGRCASEGSGGSRGVEGAVSTAPPPLSAHLSLAATAPAVRTSVSVSVTQAPEPAAVATVTAAAGAGVTVTGLAARTAGRTPPGLAGVPDRAHVVPLPAGRPDGDSLVLVAGLSPNAAFDEDYRDFVEVLADTVGAAVARAGAHRDAVARAEALARLDQAKTAFFGNISHEFRTPLTLMLGPLRQVLARMDDSDPNRADVEVAERSALRMLRLVNTLLDFSSIEAGRMVASFEPTDVGTVTAELAGMFRPIAEAAGLELVIDCPPLPPEVYVDPGLWEKIVLNLISNAFKHTLSGRITVAVRPGEDECALSVADTGEGIPPEEVPRVFERFHRVQHCGGRSVEGTGIGLTLVRDLTELHGGEVRVESVLGRGSTFTVTLPRGRAHLPADQVSEHPAGPFRAVSAPLFLAEAERWGAGDAADHAAPNDEDVASPPDAASGAGPAPALVGDFDEQVLIVDDNADMRAYLQRILGEHWRTTAVGNGAEALELIRTGEYALVVADVMTPGLDGLDLVREVRADPATESVPVVLLSARAGEEAAVEGLATGADDYLTKPFASRELLARVGAHLVMSRLRRSATIQLDATERRFRQMSDAAPVLIWSADAKGECDFVNRAWLDYTGRTFEEELGEGWAECVHPADVDALCAIYNEAFTYRRPFDVEYRHRRADGSYGWVIARGVPRIDSDGVFCGFVGACTDITERRRNEERHRILAEITAGLDTRASLADQLGRTGTILVPAFADRCTLEVPAPDGRLLQLLDVRQEGGGPAEVTVPEEALEQWLEAGGQGPAEATGPPACRAVPNAVVSPISVQGRVLGALTLVGSAGRPAYEREDRLFAAELARRLGLHLDYTRLLHVERVARRDVERAAARTARLQEITADLSGALTADEVATVIVRHVMPITGTSALVSMPDESRTLVTIAVSGDEPRDRDGFPGELPGELARVMRDRMPCWHAVTSEGRGYALLPMAVEDQVLGVLGVRLPEGRRLTGAEQDELIAIAGLGGRAAQRAGRFDIEHRAAATLQHSLLPERLPCVPGLDTWASYITAASDTTIGGDWYDLLPLEDDRIAVVIGDVSGHGVAAAAVMGQIRSSLSAYLMEGHDPGQALVRTARMAEALEPDLMVTVCCGVLHLESGILEYANAGHPPPLVCRSDGHVGYLRSAVSPPLGIGEREPYQTFREPLPPGTTLVLYTDGLIERRGESIDEGMTRLAERLAESRGDLKELGKRLLLPMLGVEGTDDTALLLVRTNGAPLSLHLEFPADGGNLADLRRTLAKWLSAAHLTELEEFEFLLACSEAVSNAAEHGYAFQPGVVTVDGRISAGQVEIRVSDQGTWRDPCSSDRGRGIPLMRAVMDSVTIDPGPSGTTVEMRRRLRRKECS